MECLKVRVDRRVTLELADGVVTRRTRTGTGWEVLLVGAHGMRVAYKTTAKGQAAVLNAPPSLHAAGA